MNNCVCIVGGSRGIGAATVREFAKSGYKVVFTYNNSKQEAQKICDELCEYGVISFKCDISSVSDIKNFYYMVKNNVGFVKNLIINAGIAQQKMFCDITENEWDKMFNVNVKGAFYIIKEFLPDMVLKKEGNIITVSSVWGITGASCESHYAASKAALIGLTKSLALELGLSNIRVNCVAPGIIKTEMNEIHDEHILNELAQQTSLGRLGKPREIATVIKSLCSDDMSYVTGQVIAATGGFVI